MSLIQEFASYRGVVVEHAVGATKESQLPQLVAKLRALERYDFDEKMWVDWTPREDCEITAYLVLFDKSGKPIFHIKDIQHTFEWDGASLTGLDELDLEGAEVQFEVVANTYKGETKPKVARISKYDDVPGTGAVQKLDAEALAKMNTKHAAALKALSGGPKAATAKGKATTKTATTAKTVAAPPPPPPAKTEEEAVADAAAPVAEPVAENKEKAKSKAPAAPPRAPAKQTATEAVKGRELTYRTAWDECLAKKLKTVTDDAVGVSFTRAMLTIAPGKVEEITPDTPEGAVEISGEEWGRIADTVLGECGGS